MGKSISFFNHKGGVGKTTSVHNIGYGLAKLGKRVLMIDADPQMNLTASIYGLSTDSIYSDDESTKWRQYNDEYTSLEFFLKSAITRRKIEKNFYEFTDDNVKFDLLRGSIGLNSLDSQIMQIIQVNNPLNKGSITEMYSSLKNLYNNYDVILVDQSPSASSILNAVFSFTSSYLIVPCTPTFFSLQAVNNLEDVWIHWNELLQNYKETSNANGLPFKSKFLGLLIQLGKRYKGGNAKHTEEWKKIVNEGIASFINNPISRSLTKNEFGDIFKDSDPYIIATFDHFTDKLRSIYEKTGIPFVALTKDDLPPESSKNNRDKQYLKSWESIQNTNDYVCRNISKIL